MNKINKNRNLNSTRLESNAIKSEPDKENKLKKQSSNKIEELNNKTRNGPMPGMCYKFHKVVFFYKNKQSGLIFEY